MILIVIKLGEDMFYILFSYSYALIFYVKYQESASLLIYSRQAYVYFFMLRRIFDGVGKQILSNLSISIYPQMPSSIRVDREMLFWWAND